MAVNNFVGLFGRQASLGLDVPKWVTIYMASLGENAVNLCTEYLIEAISIIGCHGVTAAMDRPIISFTSDAKICDIRNALFDRNLRLHRPYFRGILSNVCALNDDMASGAIVVVNDGCKVELPAIFHSAEVLYIDCVSTAVAKVRGRDLAALSSEISAMGMVPRLASHWRSAMSTEILDSMLVQLAMNVLVKPNRFATGTFFFASDYADEMVVRSFNEQKLRHSSAPKKG